MTVSDSGNAGADFRRCGGSDMMCGRDVGAYRTGGDVRIDIGINIGIGIGIESRSG